MNDAVNATPLYERIQRRHRRSSEMAHLDMNLAQLLILVVALASIASSVLAAAGADKYVVAAFAALPAAAQMIDRGFGFATRCQLHRKVASQTELLLLQIESGECDRKAIQGRYAQILEYLDNGFPISGPSGVGRGGDTGTKR